MRVAAIITILMVVSSTVSAECYKNARGRTVCSNGQKAGGYNAKTGRLEVREESEWSSYDADERGGDKPRPRMAKACIRVPMAKFVARQQIVTAVTEECQERT